MIEQPFVTTLDADDLKHNERVLLIAFLYTMFHGALRKWVFSGAINNGLFFVQLILPFVVIALMRRDKSVFSYFPLVPYGILLALLGANPLNGSIYHGIFGFMLHFGFWLLIITYINERDAFPLENILKPIIIACLIQCVLGFFQFSLPVDHFLNRYESGDGPSGFLTGAVRVVGTFSYIGGFAAFVYFTGFMIWSLMVEEKRPLILTLVLAFMCLIAGFMNGSRSMVLPFVLCLFFGFLSYGETTNKIKVMLIIPLLIAVGMLFNVQEKLPFINTAYEAFMGRVDSGRESGESNARANETLAELLDFDSENPIFGLGLGGTYQGATQLWGKSQSLINYGYYEEEPERILLEGGYLLFVVRILLFLFIAFKMRIPIFYSLPFLAYGLFFTPMVSNTFQATFVFWGLAFVDKMYYLKAAEAEREDEEFEEFDAQLSPN
jgi:hypothetical protein